MNPLEAWDGLSSAAIITPGARVSWDDLAEQVSRLAAVIGERTAPGGRVAIIGGNVPETLLSHLACLVSGRAAVGVNPRLTADEVAYLLTDSGAQLVLGERSVAGGAVVDGQLHVSGGAVLWGDGVPVEMEWNSVLKGAEVEALPLDLAPAVPLLYTSGTSGRPKGTRVRWVADPGVDVGEFIDALISSVSHLPSGPHLVAGPMYHNGPLLAVRAVLGGRQVILPGRFDAEEFLRLVEYHRVESSLVVPTHLTRLLALDPGDRLRYDTSTLSKVLMTGAACPPETKREIIDWWGPILDEAYGGTEAGTVCRIGSADWLEHRGSVGKATPGFECLVIDASGEALPAGATGRLFFRDLSGRGIEYHNDPAKTAAAHLEPGVFTLGDVGYMDADGYVFITDRDIDMVISGGVNIYPAEVERVLSEHDGVADVTVLGLPETDLGEELVALVVARPRRAVSREDLDAWCRKRLAGYKCPRRYELVDALPRDGMGKLNKKRLRRDLLAAAGTHEG